MRQIRDLLTFLPNVPESLWTEPRRQAERQAEEARVERSLQLAKASNWPPK